MPTERKFRKHETSLVCWKLLLRAVAFLTAVSQDLLQKHADTITEHCEDVVGISDDLIFYGGTYEEHDREVITFSKVDLILSPGKCTIKTNKGFRQYIRWQGCIFQTQRRFRTLQICQPHKTSQTYRNPWHGRLSSNHVRRFSDHTETPRDLLKADTSFEWSKDHQLPYEEIKNTISRHMASSTMTQESRLLWRLINQWRYSVLPLYKRTAQ